MGEINLTKKQKKDFNFYLIGTKWKFFLLLASQALLIIMQTGSALIYGELVNQVSRGVEVKKLIWSITFTLIYSIISSLLLWLFNYMEDIYFNKRLFEVKNDYFAKVVNAKYSYIASSDSSKYMSNIQNDISTVMYNYVGSIVWLTSASMMVVSSFIASLILNWKITLTMLVFTVIMAILPLFIKKPLDRSSAKVSKLNISFMGIIKEKLLGVSIIKGFSAEKISSQQVVENHKEFLKEQKKQTFINSCAGGLGMLIREIAVVALIGLTCYFVYLKEVEIGAVLSIFSIGTRFYGGILSASSAVTVLGGGTTVKHNLAEVFAVENTPEPENKLSFNNSLALKNVNFSYNDKERKILEDINLNFEKNKKYLILGKSGSGKSTLLKLISKYYDNYQGNIILDEVNYENYSEKQITTMISISQQNCYLFNSTFSNNIDFLCEGDKKRLEWVINETALADFVTTLPNGLNTIINEEVNQVSGGEKLRINLARALYRKSDILLLDEVTSSLDKKTAEIVETNLLSIVDKTIINVCHKFNDKTLPIYDKIIIIENGKIVKIGNYNQLDNDPILNNYRNIAN